MSEPTSKSQRSAIRAAHDVTEVLEMFEIGLTDRLETEVRSGLEEGEMVVAHPSDSIRDVGYVESR